MCRGMVVHTVFWSSCRTREGVEDLACRYWLSFWKEEVSSQRLEMGEAVMAAPSSCTASPHEGW